MIKSRWKIRVAPQTVDPELGFFAHVVGGDTIVPWSFEATAIREDAKGWPPITMQITMDDRGPVIRQLTIGMRWAIAVDRSQAQADDAEIPYRVGPQGANGVDTEPDVAPLPVTASLLRELPLARLAKHAMLGAAWRLDAVTGQGELVVPGELRDDDGFYLVGPGETELEDFYGVYIFDEPAWDDHWTEHMQALAKDIQSRDTRPRRNRITDELLSSVAQVYRQAMENGRPPKKAVATALHVSQATAGRYVMQARTKGFLGPTQPGTKGELRS